MSKRTNYLINLSRYLKINIHPLTSCTNYAMHFKEKENNEYLRYYLEYDKMREKKGIAF